MSEETHFYVVVYDISHDRRRTRLHNRLLDYGSPVQYSVFECILDAKRLARMKKMIKRTIKESEDQVRIYHLCEACLQKTWLSRASVEVLDDPPAIVV